MDYPQPGLRDGSRRNLRPEDYRGQGRFGPAHPHAHAQGWPQHDAQERRAERRCAPHDCRHDGPCSIDHRLRQQEPDELLPPGASPGGTDQRVLGRPQPLGAGACAAGLDQWCGHVQQGQPAGEPGRLRHHAEADRGDAFARRQCRRLPAHRRLVCGMPPRL